MREDPSSSNLPYREIASTPLLSETHPISKSYSSKEFKAISNLRPLSHNPHVRSLIHTLGASQHCPVLSCDCLLMSTLCYTSLTQSLSLPLFGVHTSTPGPHRLILLHNSFTRGRCCKRILVSSFTSLDRGCGCPSSF